MPLQNDVTSLDSSVFEAFACVVEKQYIYLCDVKRDVWRWSAAGVKAFGLPGEYVFNFSDMWMDKVHPDDRARTAQAFELLFHGAVEHNCEYRVKNAEGRYIWVLCKGRLLKNDGEPGLCVGILTDLGQRNKFDQVTGLYSLSQFETALCEALLPEDACGGVLVWGIDYFRRINDEFGYAFGTELLCAYAQQLCIRFPERTFYRLEGDRFAMICPGEGEAELSGLFEAIFAVGRNGLQVEGKAFCMAVSGGAVFYPVHGTQANELYPKLDYALECAKNQHREGLTIFTGSLHVQALRSFQLQQNLRKCVENGCEGFSLYYQPILSADAHVLTGVEALLRWSDPMFPFVTPTEFIPILESYGDIHKVGKWVLSTALRQMREWQAVLPELRVSVNVSYLQMRDPSFKNFVLEQVEQWGFPKKLLILELTESCNIVNPKELARDLNEFRQNGIQIALDDFGTGYASLSVLRDLSTDWIKVDHSFVAQIANNEFDKALTEYLIGLCNKLDLRVCVEGIETEEIQNVIERFHPDTLQGYFYSRPVDVATFEEKYLYGTSFL